MFDTTKSETSFAAIDECIEIAWDHLVSMKLRFSPSEDQFNFWRKAFEAHYVNNPDVMRESLKYLALWSSTDAPKTGTIIENYRQTVRDRMDNDLLNAPARSRASKNFAPETPEQAEQRRKIMGDLKNLLNQPASNQA